MYSKWRKVFGRCVPANADSKALEAGERYQDTEEFIEDLYPLDVQYELAIDCSVAQDGFRPMNLAAHVAKQHLATTKQEIALHGGVHQRA